jgi:hypothetical protein
MAIISRKKVLQLISMYQQTAHFKVEKVATRLKVDELT